MSSADAQHCYCNCYYISLQGGRNSEQVTWSAMTTGHCHLFTASQHASLQCSTYQDNPQSRGLQQRPAHKAKGPGRLSTVWHDPALSHGSGPRSPHPPQSTPSPSDFSRQIIHIGDNVACKRAPAPGLCQECQVIPAVARGRDEEISSEPCEKQTEGMKEDDSFEQRSDIQISPLLPPLLFNMFKCYFITN